MTFPLEINVTEIEAPRHICLRTTGTDSRTGSRLEATLDVRVRLDSDNSPALELAVRGKLATLGQGVIARKAEETFAAFSANLIQLLELDSGGLARCCAQKVPAEENKPS